VLLGALLLQASLMPSAFATDGSDTVVVPATTTTTTASTTTTTTAVAPVTTTTTTAVAPVTTTTTTPAETTPAKTTPGEPIEGTLTISPKSGPLGSVITVKSKTLCKAPAGTDVYVDAFVVNLADLKSGKLTANSYDEQQGGVAADGSWSIKLTVPAAGKTGDYLVAADCFTDDAAETTIVTYDYVLFTATASAAATTTTTEAAAKPAAAVAGNPAYTG
jgi:hypothetical protein